ncbi:MAG: hypothetical protein ABII20_06390 [Candidatus Omnitrophota bacterium]
MDIWIVESPAIEKDGWLPTKKWDGSLLAVIIPAFFTRQDAREAMDTECIKKMKAKGIKYRVVKYSLDKP